MKFLHSTILYFIGITVVIYVIYQFQYVEGFADSKCSALTSCGTCTTMDGCGWCSKSEVCRTLEDGCPGQAEEYINATAQCASTEVLAGGNINTRTDQLTYNEGKENRRMQLIKKYVDRIVLNVDVIVKDENKKEMKDYIKKNLC